MNKRRQPGNPVLQGRAEGQETVKSLLPAVSGLIAALALAGCNTQTALNSTPPTTATQAPATQAPATPASSTQPSAASSTGSSAGAAAPAAGQADQAALPTPRLSAQRVQFAPIVGVTPESVGALSSELSARAQQRGLKIVQANDKSTTLLMKGYFSALTDSNQTTVIYVWDVLDPAGNRLHRIEGQQKAPSGKGQGFAAVTGDTMKAVADQTIDQLVTWLSSQKS